MESVTIRPPNPDDVGPLEAMITAHFGAEGSYTVELGLDDPDLHVLVADAGTKLVGVMGLGIYDDRREVEAEMYLIDSLEEVRPADRYGLLQMGYIRDGCTGRGIGSRLLERLERIGREQGVTLFVTDAWFHGGPDTPERLFDAHGYDVPHRHSIADRSEDPCPKCTVSCRCEAALVAKGSRPQNGPSDSQGQSPHWHR